MELVSLHLFALLVTFCAIVYADHEGFAYIRGKKNTLNPRRVSILHQVVLLGLIIMIVTGTMLAIPVWSFLKYETEFYIKMGFVSALVINAFVIGRFIPTATERAFATLTSHEQKILLGSGTVSVIGWIGAAVIGYFYL